MKTVKEHEDTFIHVSWGSIKRLGFFALGAAIVYNASFFAPFAPKPIAMLPAATFIISILTGMTIAVGALLDW
jgi:hypothetical protein